MNGRERVGGRCWRPVTQGPTSAEEPLPHIPTGSCKQEDLVFIRLVGLTSTTTIEREEPLSDQQPEPKNTRLSVRALEKGGVVCCCCCCCGSCCRFVRGFTSTWFFG